MQLRHSLLALAALMVPLVACGLIVGIEDHQFTTPDGSVAMAEAGPVPPAIAPTCTFGAAPPEVGPPDDDPTIMKPLVFAVRHASIRGRSTEGAIVGFDYDGVCSCDPRDQSLHEGGVSCIPPAGAPQGAGCDEDGGIDNAIASIFDLIALLPGGDFASAADAINSQIRCGDQTMIYTVYDYNGLANDSQVTLAGTQSNGIHEAQDGGTVDDAGMASCGVTQEGILDAGLPYPAKFDGNDVWSKQSGASGATVTGYVRNFKLVLDGRPRAGLTNATLPLLFGSRVLTIGTPIVVAQLVPLDEKGDELKVDGAGKIVSPSGKASSFRLDNGLVGGRASAADLHAATATIRVAGAAPGTQLCDVLNKYCPVKQLICNAADSRQSPIRDFRGETCDALTVTLQFDAVVAKITEVERPAQATGDGGCALNFEDGCPGDAAICPP